MKNLRLIIGLFLFAAKSIYSQQIKLEKANLGAP
jgi:hypothetical protein